MGGKLSDSECSRVGKLIRRANHEIGKCVVHRARDILIEVFPNGHRQLSSPVWQVLNPKSGWKTHPTVALRLIEGHQPIRVHNPSCYNDV